MFQSGMNPEFLSNRTHIDRKEYNRMTNNFNARKLIVGLFILAIVILAIFWVPPFTIHQSAIPTCEISTGLGC